MTILSDRQIKQLCTLPNFVITELKALTQDPDNLAYYLHREIQSFSYLLEGELISKIKNRGNGIGIVKYRPLTEEEVSAFKPIISPFVGKQVKTRGRVITRAEYDAFARKPESDMTETYIIDRNEIHGSYAKIPERIISYGLTSYGYDVRLAEQFKIFSNMLGSTIDPLAIHQDCFVEQDASVNEAGYVILPPNSYLLGVTQETFAIPRDVTAICVGKSTYARCGIAVNVTPIEAGFEGQVVIEVANQTSLPARIYANMGIAQFLFFRGDQPCDVSYADRGGKYQGQSGITDARV
jgi:dCTP deaminase